jgi:putative flippase GtrA
MRPLTRLVGGLWSLRLSRFAAIGILSTALYAVLALVFNGLGLEATGASVLAFGLASVFSYTGHKYVTYASGGRHAFELPRFLALSAAGLAVVSMLPALLTGLLGLPAAVPILLACIVVPIVNYVVLGRWVFASRRAFPERNASP